MSDHTLVNKFGPEPIQYFSLGGKFQHHQKSFKQQPQTETASSLRKLNRLSFLRDNYAFLNSALHHHTTRFVLFKDGNPFIETNDSSDLGSLGTYPNHFDSSSKTAITDSAEVPKYLPARPVDAVFSYTDLNTISSLIGEPFAKSEKEMIAEWDPKLHALGQETVSLVFLGINEDLSSTNQNSQAFEWVTQHSDDHVDRYIGQAYFALDLSSQFHHTPALSKKISQVITAVEKQYPTSQFVMGLKRRFTVFESSLFAQAKPYLDWLSRNLFCGGCGNRQMIINGGNKLTCPETVAGAKQPFCPTRGRVTNLHFPRTDCCVIMAVINKKGDKVLLAHNRRHPNKRYSCLAGFIEPGESIEDAVRREVWEESGVKVDRVVPFTTQPWPQPGNIMIGCVAQCESIEDEPINLGHDPELTHADWFPFDFTRLLLERAYHGLELQPFKDGEISNRIEQSFCQTANDMALPGPETIAFSLIEAVVNGRVTSTPKI
ncbi:hypothetical protein NADFUDRAFT_82220 [Nadsonia fulvescens var. elongata DSM 6958]|uniref:NAD(+) diphosphatase n=1 Tax=Nadsonia fulvescens var. elongata DSM 6958 TaxID=857566 RepID=A0A1E3PLR6_9ASCO|nr:hypothetical protein NADFUDRAFT_82220 [Nadsonia fulvescens var. elongata DSM 6958]